MSGQMSTPLNNLPAVDASAISSTTNDPMVTDVLAEMEREVAAAQRPSSTPTSGNAHVHSHPPYQAHYAQSSNQPIHGLFPPYMKQQSTTWIDTNKLQNAVVASVIAVCLLIPNVSFLYDKFERLTAIKSYELFIRVALLSLVLYLIMVRFGI